MKIWYSKVDQLVEFKKQKGHLYVSKKNAPHLFSFVKNMRHFKHRLSQEQITLLDNIGFVWNPGREGYYITHLERKSSNWLNRYEELKQFKEQYGHFKIPDTRKFRALLAWARAQKLSKELTNEQIEMLDEINFLEEQGYLPWKTVIKALLEFKSQFGHLHINPYLSDDKQLMNSVKRLRMTRHRLSVKRIAKLNALEFVWKSIDPVWIKRYEDLKEYKKEYGTCHIAPDNNEFNSLANWVHFQRKNKELSGEKRKLLEKIGFFNDLVKTKLKI